jgi:hypothetical protein
MTAHPPKFVARAEAGVGWRIFNRQTKRAWGNYFREYPATVLAELNGDARQSVLVELCRSTQSKLQVAKTRRKKA